MTTDNLTPEEICDIQRGFAAEHVRKGWYGDDDLRILGITREEAEKVHRDRAVQHLANRFRNDPDVLREALAVIETLGSGKTSGAQAAADHFHVIAIQDWGGSQEYWWLEDEPHTREQAVQHVADMVDADSLVYRVYDAATAERKYGGRLDRLISTNVAPGWEAVWIVPCGDPCRRMTIGAAGPESWGEPFWTPKPDGPQLSVVPTDPGPDYPF